MANHDDKKFDEREQHISGEVDAAPDEKAVETFEVKDENPGVYKHNLSKPFVWEDKTYKFFVFDFNSLTGKDMAEVEREMADDNDFAIAPEYSASYMLKLAARAAKVDVAVIENLPLVEANKIRAKTRSFMTRGAF